MSLNAKSFLLHQYLYNLQFGINGLKYISITYNGISTIITTPYFNLMHRPIRIYATPITKQAWHIKNPQDYPILLKDNGCIINSFQSLNINFHIESILAWQIETSFKFHNQVSIKKPRELKDQFGIITPTDNWNIISLTSHLTIYRQLCIYIAFLLTAQDLYLYYYRDVSHE